MQSTATTPTQYMQELPADRKPAMTKLRKMINDHIPKGFQEQMTYGMLGWVVPHSIYPPGYHVTPELPLGFICLASQKNFIALYHAGVYADKNLYDWFTNAYPKHAKTKLDMGKSCIRFKNLSDIPYDLVGELVEKLSVEDFIAFYERGLPDAKKKK